MLSLEEMIGISVTSSSRVERVKERFLKRSRYLSNFPCASQIVLYMMLNEERMMEQKMKKEEQKMVRRRRVRREGERGLLMWLKRRAMAVKRAGRPGIER